MLLLLIDKITDLCVWRERSSTGSVARFFLIDDCVEEPEHRVHPRETTSLYPGLDVAKSSKNSFFTERGHRRQSRSWTEGTQQKQHESMADEETPSSGSLLCSINHLLRLPERADQKEVVLRILQAARVQPAAVMPVLMVTLRHDEVSAWQKVTVYHSLRAMLEHGLEVEPLQDFILVASKQLRASPEQGVPRELQVAASSTLATFARRHFNPIMTELQKQLKPFVQPDEFLLLTLGKMAASNVYGCVPFLGITLTTLQTTMRGMEDGRRRRALCMALGQICGAIRIYLRSWERSSHPRLSVQQFATYLLPLYACITRTWLPGSDAQVKLAILKVLGPMLSILLTQKEFQAQVHGDIPLLVAQYESSIEAVHVTKILSQILEASLVNNNQIPRRHVEPLARVLTHQVKLKESQEEARVVLLVLLSKIVGAQLPELWSRRQLCVKAIKVVLGDDSIRVRFAVLQVISKLLQAGYLEKVEGWPLNYISLQLAISAHQLDHSRPSLPLGGLEEKVIQRASVEALQAAVASGRGTSQELWAKLLAYLMQPHFTGLAASLCHILRMLAEQQRRRVLQDGLEAVNSPTPQELLARLLSLAVSPFDGSGRGVAVLLLLQVLRPQIYKDVAEQWWVEVPAMVDLLEGHSKYTLKQAAWEQRLLEFLKKSLRRNQKRGWNLELGHELAKQMNNYPSSSAEKAFLYRALGTALSTAGDVARVALHLQELLLHADYADEDQREGLCQCLACCGEGQFPATLKALSQLEEEISKVEDSDLPLPEQDRVKSAFLLMYSSAVTRAPQQQLLLHLTADVMPKILHHCTPSSPEVAKDPELILSFTRCVSEVCLSIRDGGEAAAIQLPHKRALVDHLVDIIRAQPLDALMSPVRQQAMVALRHLSTVPEALSHEENRELAELCLGCIFALPPLELTDHASEALYTGAVASLAELVETLLEEEEEGGDASSKWVQEVFQLLLYWLVSEQEWERARAMQLSARLLKEHHRRTTASARISFGQYSRLVGALGPFTYDTPGTTRQAAGDCIRTLLSIQGVVTPQTPEGRREDWKLQRIQQDLQSECPREVHAASFRLAKIVSSTIPSQEILTYLCSLLEQLGTVSVACDRAVLLWFEVMLRERGPDLRDKVCDLVAFICSSLQHSEDPAQRLSLARAVATLSKYHLKTVCASLLEQPLLQDRARKELWAVLVTRTESCLPIVRYLLRQLRAGGGTGEAGGDNSQGPVLAALQEVIVGLNDCDRLLPLLPELCYFLLCRLSRGPDAERLISAPLLERNEDIVTSRRLAVGVLQAVFDKALPETARELDVGDAWHFLAESHSFLQGVAQLARALGCSGHPLLDGLLHLLLPSLSSSSTTSRDLSLVFCAEFTGHPLLHRPQTLHLLLQQLLSQSHDGDATRRLLAVRGLGAMAKCAPEEALTDARTAPQAKKQQKALLAALLDAAGEAASLDVAGEGLCALGKMLGCLGGRHLGRALQAVAHQACAHLQQADDALRAAAFELFGHLAEIAQEKHIRGFAKEVRDASAALLLHFRDPSPAVGKACYTAFVLCAPFLSLRELTLDMDPASLMDVSGTQHSRLMGRVCQQLAQTDPALLEVLTAEVPKYMHCPWEEIQIAACQLAGILAENMEVQQLRQLDLRPLLQDLHSLCDHCTTAMEITAKEAIDAIGQKWQGAGQQLNYATNLALLGADDDVEQVPSLSAPRGRSPWE
ncbi:PREDICTED: maestro heat-like repeat-containing protein family member 2A [Gekko japonicus]|uniref:Maestro heat-like repeat-containing protein family member 2A n=1 Tax=Gekko japonicus TaxID=146911 RepID=A0ABM1K5P1_GEKJA|nr:PREDICTED: maestro heat-like repeat-containing protein family member 2A [Gekko japonicus]